MSDTQIVSTKNLDKSMDSYLTQVCLESTMGDVVRSREISENAKAYTINGLIFNAVFDMDIELIKTLVNRIDGLVPAEGDRESYANLMGDALDDVLSYPSAQMLKVKPYDKPIIAMAKIIVAACNELCGNNQLRRKQRNLAASMLLERTGGRKIEPTRPLLETQYDDPKWLSQS